jgi:hypothetical protein
VIVFDESHAMQNAAGEKSERGDKGPSQQGRAGLRLQHALPNARVLYVSATGATTVHNLAYAQRLGLWGSADFPFATRAEFVLSASGTISRNCRRRMVRLIDFSAADAISSLHGFSNSRQLKAIVAEGWKSWISPVGTWRALGRRSDD